MRIRAFNLKDSVQIFEIILHKSHDYVEKQTFGNRLKN